MLVSPQTFPQQQLEGVVESMTDLMLSSNGIGLAANQIGTSRRFFIYQIKKGVVDIVVNPVIKEKSEETFQSPEGCLSLPGEEVIVPRHEWIIVRGMTYDNKPRQMRVTGYLASVFQHEIDHLDGRLITDYVGVA